MATKKTSKKATNEEWFNESVNEVSLMGKVKRVLFDGEKVTKFTLETVTKTPNNNYAHQFINVTLFSESETVEEGEFYHIEGYITTESYGEGKNKKYTTTVVANELELVEM